MGPSRKARSVKRFSHINEVSPNKDGENDKKNIQRKRKSADMLGLQWGREELERFYKAYRKYGMNGKKVAAAVRNRSVEMVEALYTMNKAYLSLPEGTATVDGLIAMMTDHYCNLVGSDSEQESNDGAGTSQRPQKRARVKVKPTISKGSDTPSHSQAVASGYGCLSLLKKRRSGGSRPRAVGKRTPRFPVPYSYENDNGEKYFSPSRQGLKPRADDNEDEVAHEIALVLTEASHRGGSPQVSETPKRRTESVMSSPVRNAQRMVQVEARMTSSKFGGNMDENDLEESMEADNGDFSMDKMYFMERETSGKIVQRRKLYGSKLEIDHSGNDHIDDVKEACSGTEEGQKLGASREKFDIEVTGAKISRSPYQGQKKRSKKALFKRDEGLEFDALQTLANLSLMMPTSTNENDSPVQVKEENDYLNEEPGVNHQREKLKSSAVKAKANLSVSRFDVASEKALKPGKVSILDASVIPESQQEAHQSSTKMSKKKHKFLASKTSKAKGHSDVHPSESQEAETGDIGKKLINKGKRSTQSASPKLGKLLEGSSSSTDPRKEGSDTVQSTAQIPPVNQVSLPTKVRSRRKTDLQKPQALKDGKFYNKVVKDRTSAFPSFHDRATNFNFKEKLSNGLSNSLLRRWCAFEWFYSAIDYPWFAKREFVEYLYHVGLGHVPRLTRVEWGVIRSSLGKPRRFSEQFLKEEKEKLKQYRGSVREHYTELRAGTREGLPTDLAKPLSVGQRVIAIHPKTREIHDGSVLTVDHNRCRVQFDRPDLGVEFVKDIDCMPLNPSENMPTSQTRHMLSVDTFFENVNELKFNGWSKDQRLEGYKKISTGQNMVAINVPSHVTSSTYPVNSLIKQVATTAGPKGSAISQPTAYSQPFTLAQIQAKEADVQALAELTRALEKKEAVVLELRRMNDDVLENQKDGDCSLKDSEPFKKQYAAILVQLNEVNEQVSSALYCLRQRNSYQRSLQLESPRPVVNLGDPVCLLNSLGPSTNNAQESGPHVNEIVESSRMKARIMVDAAMQAMSLLKVGGNTIDKIEEAIDYVNDKLPLDESCMPTMRASINTDSSHCSSTYEDQLNSSRVNLCQATDPNMKNASDRNEAQIPSELITHCVATLLMIQRCTERQFPPADVAQILDSAVTSLQPCCSQNLPVYAEIQKCMGIIKNQILALVPT